MSLLPFSDSSIRYDHDYNKSTANGPVLGRFGQVLTTNLAPNQTFRGSSQSYFQTSPKSFPRLRPALSGYSTALSAFVKLLTHAYLLCPLSELQHPDLEVTDPIFKAVSSSIKSLSRSYPRKLQIRFSKLYPVLKAYHLVLIHVSY